MKKDWSTAILVIIFFVGLSVLLYPTISDLWNSRHQTQAIMNYEAAMQDVDEKDYTEIVNAANKYNQEIAKVSYPLMNYAEVPGYDEILNVGGDGIMGYIKIPKIKVSLPVYHGTSSGVLAVAVGHVPGSSLPIGGPGTHAVLSAHRGLPSAKLFSDLDELVVGDTFTFNVLDQTLTYEVDQILVVLPHEVDALAIEEGRDYCTLVTCTPYGVNSHRILVRGKRVVNSSGIAAVRVPADAVILEPIIVAPVVAVPMLLLLLIWLMVHYRDPHRTRVNG